MNSTKIFYGFKNVLSLISLNKDREDYEIIKHNLLEVLNKIDNVKNDDYLIKSDNNYSYLILKDLTDEEMKNVNYSDLLFHTLIEINYLNKEYEQINDPLTLNQMLKILEERKNIMIYNLSHTIEEQYKDKDLNDIYFNEYEPLFKKILDDKKYDSKKNFIFIINCRNELIKQYKQNDNISYKDFDDIIKNSYIDIIKNV